MSIVSGKLKTIGDKKYHIVTTALAIIYAICVVLGSNIENYDEGRYTDLHTYLNILLYGIVIKLIIDLLVFLIGRIKRLPELGFVSRMSDKKFLFISWLILAIAYLPTFITCFPGLAIYDGPAQTVSLSRHHPFLHTMFVQFCCLVQNVTGMVSWVLVYSILQFVLFTFAYALIFLKMRRLGMANIYLAVTFCITALFPLNGLFAITTTKDVLFSLLFALWVLELIDILKDGSDYLNNRRSIVRFAIISTLMCGFRNNALYVFVATGILFAVFIRQNRKKWIIYVASIAIAFGIFNGPVLTAAGVPQGNMREALSVIIQPLARTYNYASDYLTEDEKVTIEKLFNGDAPWYVSHISDAPKSQFNSNVFKENMPGYLGFYIREGLKYPTIYMDALLATTYGNWYPFETLPDETCFRLYFEFPDKTASEYGTVFAGYYDWLKNFSRNSSYNSILPLKMVMSGGFAFWMMLAALAYGIIRKKARISMIVIPSIMLWGTIMLGPVALFRYSYPLMVTNIIILGLIFTDYFSNKTK